MPQPRRELSFEVPPKTLAGWTVYRLFDSGEALLYVGYTSIGLRDRLVVHAGVQPWFGDVARCSAQDEWSYAAARWAEYDAIVAERPRYNRRAFQPSQLACGPRPTYVP